MISRCGFIWFIFFIIILLYVVENGLFCSKELFFGEVFRFYCCGKCCGNSFGFFFGFFRFLFIM